MNNNINPVNIRFNPSELEKIELAKKYTNINSTPTLVRSCVSMGMRDIPADGKINMTFSIGNIVDKTKAYAMGVTFDDDCCEKLEKIFQCIPMTPSYIIKYYLMPEIDKIIENKGWSR